VALFYSIVFDVFGARNYRAVFGVALLGTKIGGEERRSGVEKRVGEGGEKVGEEERW
jgi:hypothetical protein